MSVLDTVDDDFDSIAFDEADFAQIDALVARHQQQKVSLQQLNSQSLLLQVVPAEKQRMTGCTI